MATLPHPLLVDIQEGTIDRYAGYENPDEHSPIQSIEIFRERGRSDWNIVVVARNATDFDMIRKTCGVNLFNLGGYSDAATKTLNFSSEHKAFIGIFLEQLTKIEPKFQNDAKEIVRVLEIPLAQQNTLAKVNTERAIQVVPGQKGPSFVTADVWTFMFLKEAQETMNCLEKIIDEKEKAIRMEKFKENLFSVKDASVLSRVMDFDGCLAPQYLYHYHFLNGVFGDRDNRDNRDKGRCMVMK